MHFAQETANVSQFGHKNKDYSVEKTDCFGSVLISGSLLIEFSNHLELAVPPTLHLYESSNQAL